MVLNRRTSPPPRNAGRPIFAIGLFFRYCLWSCIFLLVVLQGRLQAQQDPVAEARLAESKRVETIAKAMPATIGVFSTDGQGGGSGVVISADGFALTNWHVVDPCGTAMYCSMPDGRVYDAVLAGIDPVGDVALIKLQGRDDFPVAVFANSDEVKVGDFCFAVGNPFLLASNFQPLRILGNRLRYASIPVSIRDIA